MKTKKGEQYWKIDMDRPITDFQSMALSLYGPVPIYDFSTKSFIFDFNIDDYKPSELKKLFNGNKLYACSIGIGTKVTK